MTNFIFSELSYKVDDNKNLYYIDNEEKLIGKLNRNIYKLIKDKDSVYFIDAYGDVFSIKDNEIKYIFGIISQPLYFTINSNFFYVIDNYSRLWIVGINGKIKKFIFFDKGDKISDILFENEFFEIKFDNKISKYEYIK